MNAEEMDMWLNIALKKEVTTIEETEEIIDLIIDQREERKEGEHLVKIVITVIDLVLLKFIFDQDILQKIAPILQKKDMKEIEKIGLDQIEVEEGDIGVDILDQIRDHQDQQDVIIAKKKDILRKIAQSLRSQGKKDVQNVK